MKKEFSVHWKGSRQIRKQRKYVAKAPKHIKQKLLSCHLSKELRQKYARRAFQLRKGDSVKIMNGEFKKKTGKVSIVDVGNARAAIEGIQITKKDGSKVNAWFPVCKLMITEMNMDDKMRSDSIKKEPTKKIENKNMEKKK